ncbi:uncharacterized protein [Rutidosis leptorrhynchoides]|uniref:uncharacterized protein n=1 Tax=Rutidosis leptorrhynchoides TaxID=125765 RepID=UPI003A98E43F
MNTQSNPDFNTVAATNTGVIISIPSSSIVNATVATVATLPNAVVSHAEKPEKFTGVDFKRWQQKMLFYLTTLNLARVLTETAPQLVAGDVQIVSAVEAWKHLDYLCRNYVLNSLENSLYNVYCTIETAKELWESLERKYKTEDAGTKKWVVAKFLDFKMIDSKTIMSQIQELQVIIHDIHAEKMVISQGFQVAAIIEKLPPSWVDFKNYLKHKRKEMTVEDLVVRLRIEEDNKFALKRSITPVSAKVNIVEHCQSSKGSKSKGKTEKSNKEKGFKFGPKGGVAKRKNFSGKCFNCDQPGHRADQCTKSKKYTSKQANMVDDADNLVAMVSDLTIMIFVVNLVSSNTREWWVDTGATRHVCADKSLFKTFKEVTSGDKMFMGNSAIADIKGEGNVILKMTSGKELTLTNVLYVPEIRKNLVSGWLLNKFGFRLVFESDKVVLTKSGVYFGKDYALNGMFKLNAMVINNEANKTIETLHEQVHEKLVESEEEELELRRSKRARTEGPDFHSYMVENEPTTYREAVSSSEGPQWKESIKSEIDSILQNHTWELVDLPPGCKPLGYRWIFKKKLKPDGTIDKYKAMLVIKGYRQREGLDYFDTYSAVTRITSIKLVLSIIAIRNLEVHQMDVKTAFLNGNLEEEIYMEQPAGFKAPGQERKVCKLVKSLYGLKQAPKQWHQKFEHVMLDLGFKINECDKCVYVKDTLDGYVILCLYVDDMLIAGSNEKMIKSTKDMLKSKFDMKDMGLADVILGIKITRTHSGLVLSQTHYFFNFGKPYQFFFR